MSTELTPSNEALLEALARISSAGTAPEILDALLAASLLTAPRVSLFLVRRGRLRGFGGAGMSDDAKQRITAVNLAPDAGLAGEAARTAAPLVVAGGDARWTELEQSRPSELALRWLRVGGAPAALLAGARIPGGTPWSPAALAIVAAHAESRLEVELAKKRASAGSFAAPPSQAPAAQPALEPPARIAPSASFEPRPPAFEFTVTVRDEKPAAPQETGLAPYEDGDASASGLSPREEDARRYARLIATDIRLYHEEAVLIGRRNRDLRRRLGDQLERGRESFLRRFADLGAAGTKMLDDAYVEVLAAGDASLIRPPVGAPSGADGYSG